MSQNSYMEKMKEFHTMFEVPIAKKPKLLSPKDNIRRLTLITSEVGELGDSIRQGNIIETADALGDILYVTFGMAVEMGLHMKQAYGKTKFKNLIILSPSHALGCFAGIVEGMCAIILSVEKNNLKQITNDLDYFLQETFRMAYNIGLDMNRIFRDIHKSNMSKANADGTIIKDKGGKILKSAIYKPVDLTWILE